MKTALLITTLLFTINIYAQDSTKSGTISISKKLISEPGIIVENMPTFQGGIDALLNFIRATTKYPALALDMGISGTVYVHMIISKTGEVTDVTLIRGIGGGCDEEAIRVVSTMPAWNPGSQRGKPVAVQYTLPIKFMLR
ncbi:MAG: energy transducer TonB [Flavobacteriales bacterium]|nr:energy transducer TonB [Flavobacteriales bacterium]